MSLRSPNPFLELDDDRLNVRNIAITHDDQSRSLHFWKPADRRWLQFTPEPSIRKPVSRIVERDFSDLLPDRAVLHGRNHVWIFQPLLRRLLAVPLPECFRDSLDRFLLTSAGESETAQTWTSENETAHHLGMCNRKVDRYPAAERESDQHRV